MGFLTTTTNSILNLIFPTKCVSCGTPGLDFCIDCLSKCREAERESASWIYPLYDYRHPSIKKALWFLKYKSKRRLADIFAEAMHSRITEELSDLSIMENFHDAILIPIPLSPKRQRERGYNQAELICERLIKMDKSHMRDSVYEKPSFSLEKNVLMKQNDTKHQAHIENRAERLKNILGSFRVSNEQSKTLIKNRNIILIDDITTTGATLNEARKILKQHGARKVIAFTVAH